MSACCSERSRRHWRASSVPEPTTAQLATRRRVRSPQQVRQVHAIGDLWGARLAAICNSPDATDLHSVVR